MQHITSCRNLANKNDLNFGSGTDLNKIVWKTDSSRSPIFHDIGAILGKVGLDFLFIGYQPSWVI